MDPINQNQQQNSGLLRFLSAPSSLLSDSCEGGGFDTTSSMSRFMSNTIDDSVSQSFKSLESDFSLSTSQVNCQSQQMLLPPPPPQQYPRQALSNGSNFRGSSYGLVSSLAMDAQVQGRVVGSNLTRKNSSPAGLFSNLSAQNGYASIKDTGSYAGLNGGSGEACPSPKRLKSQLSFSSGMLSQISEVLVEGAETESSYNRKLRNVHLNNQIYSSGYPYGSWNNSVFDENIAVSQNGELGNRVHTLSHHMSLPKPSSQLVAMEKILQFQDTVPCKIRAKRGCATHPRSIAERMRRTRISERMRKLQDLVPNMDKQTNTADMLDLAVEYIKDLQKEFKTLRDSRTKCKCLNAEKPVTST